MANQRITRIKVDVRYTEVAAGHDLGRERGNRERRDRAAVRRRDKPAAARTKPAGSEPRPWAAFINEPTSGAPGKRNALLMRVPIVFNVTYDLCFFDFRDFPLS